MLALGLILLLVAGCGRGTSDDVHFSVIERPDYVVVVSGTPGWLRPFVKDGSLEVSITAAVGHLAKEPAQYFANEKYLLSVWWMTDRLLLEKSMDCMLVCSNGRKIRPIWFQESTASKPWVSTGKRVELFYRLEAGDVPETFASPKLKAPVHLSKPVSLPKELIQSEWRLTKEGWLIKEGRP